MAVKRHMRVVAGVLVVLLGGVLAAAALRCIGGQLQGRLILDTDGLPFLIRHLPTGSEWSHEAVVARFKDDPLPGEDQLAA